MSADEQAIRHEALFVSSLQPSQHADARQIRAAVRHTLRAVGRRDCLARVAQEYGDHPDTAVARMRWARDAIVSAYSERNSRSFEHTAARVAARVGG